MKHTLLLAIIMTAWVTHYTKASSCHYPKDGKCLTASGTFATPERTVACPKSLKFGSSVEIDGKTYICEDRYASWVQKRQGNTFDIFADESLKDAYKFGKKKMSVKIL